MYEHNRPLLHCLAQLLAPCFPIIIALPLAPRDVQRAVQHLHRLRSDGGHRTKQPGPQRRLLKPVGAAL